MPNTSKTALKPAFVKTVQDLVQQRDDLAGASAQFKRMWVDFCVSYTKGYEEAKTLGRAAVTHINDKVGITDQSVLSKMRKVAEAHGKHALSPKILASLPPSQEAIVELVRAELRKSGTIQRLINTDKVTPESSVRDVRAMLAKKTRRVGQVSGARGPQRVVVTFPGTEDAVEPLATLLLTTKATIAVADSTLRDDIAEHIGTERFKGVSERLTK